MWETMDRKKEKHIASIDMRTYKFHKISEKPIHPPGKQSQHFDQIANRWVRKTENPKLPVRET